MGFCKDLAASQWTVQSFFVLVSSAALVWFIRGQYVMYSDHFDGYYNNSRRVILPIHLKLLVYFAVTSVLHGFISLVLANLDVTHGFWFALVNAFSWFMEHTAIEGAAFMLMSPGIGKRSIRRAATLGMVSALVVGVTTFAAFYIDDARGQAAALCREMWLMFWFAVAWLTPRKWWPRRASAIYYCRFWALQRGLLAMSATLLMNDIEAGLCIFYVAVVFIYSTMRLWIMYRALVLETDFWHGELCVEPPLICKSISHQICRWNDADNGGKDRTSVLVGRSSNLEQASISNPFQGMTLTTRSAGTMLKVFGDGQGSERAPFIDFSNLKILPARVLGKGSSAVVYEGRWCRKRKVAVKILFTFEILPDEIERLCLEAALLHNLSTIGSHHVVGLHGVALLPPSLCLVLELCSEVFISLSKKYNPHCPFS